MNRKIGIALLLLLYTPFLFSESLPEARSDETIYVDSIPATVDSQICIYLTFDDGPLSGSFNINSVALSEEVCFSVFLVGKNIENGKLREYWKLYSENPYIDIYNHSYSHANGKYVQYYKNPQRVLEGIQKNDSLLNLQYKIVRLPGRNMWRIGERKRDDIQSGSATADLAAENGYKVIGWDLEWTHDSKTGAPEQSVDQLVGEIESMLKNNRSFTKGHVVLLMHDEMFGKSRGKNRLQQLVEKLKLNKDYQFQYIRFYPENGE